MTVKHEVLTMLAEVAVDRLVQPRAEVRGQAIEALVSIWSQQLGDAFGGEQLRLYASQRDAGQRHRILGALAAGEAPDLIARREQVTVRWVRKLRQRGTIRP